MSEAARSPDTPKKRGGKLVLGVALGVLVALGAAGGAWFAFGRGGHDAPAEANAKKHEKPLFTTLEPFTVNLQDPRGERFAQVGVTLEFDDPSTESEIKDHLPAVRNDILMLISSKQIEDLLTTEGKQQLAQQIRLRAGRAMGVDLPEAGKEVAGKDAPRNPIRGVLFSQFIVQ